MESTNVLSCIFPDGGFSMTDAQPVLRSLQSVGMQWFVACFQAHQALADGRLPPGQVGAGVRCRWLLPQSCGPGSAA